MAVANRMSVVLVLAELDDRESTVRLLVTARALNAQPGISVHTCLLRDADQGAERWPNAMVVDDLRLWRPSRLLSSIGLWRIAGKLRGAKLRLWFRRSTPDIVILNDGLGVRLARYWPDDVGLAVRENPDTPHAAVMETTAAGGDRVGAVVTGSAAASEASVVARRLAADTAFHFDVAPRRNAADAARSAARERVGVLPDETVVVGWGTDGWLDGADIMIRTLWYLEHHHGVRAHGLWLRSGPALDTSFLIEEAQRCGLADRFHIKPNDDPSDRWCGDAVFLPYRDGLDRNELLPIAAAGLPVVAFASETSPGPWLGLAPSLDPVAAAAELATSLRRGVDSWWPDFFDLHDSARWCNRLLAGTKFLRDGCEASTG